jgi:hypothetical protein
MLNCNNICRDYFLKGDYDFFFSLESDIFSAPNIIEHLLSFRKPIVGISYFLGQLFQSQYLSYVHEDFGYSSESMCMNADMAFNFIDGSLKSTFQLGLGCILISRWIIEKIPFRIDETRDAAADLFFHEDLQKEGIPVFVDTSHIAYHQNSNWDKVKAKHLELIQGL